MKSIFAFFILVSPSIIFVNFHTLSGEYSCFLHEEDVNVSGIDAFSLPISNYEDKESSIKLIHLGICSGQDSLVHNTFIFKSRKGYILSMMNNSSIKLPNDVVKSLVDLEYTYTKKPSRYHLECGLATSECLELYLLESDGKVIFKFVSTDLSYESLKNSDKEKISVAIEFFKKLDFLEKAHSN